MTRKLLFTILLLVSATAANAFDSVKLMLQHINVSDGGFIEMYTTDGIIYQGSQYVMGTGMHTYFRVNDSQNWGRHNDGFAFGGIAVLNGNPEYLPVNSYYHVIFNLSTKKYIYTGSLITSSMVRIQGTANNGNDMVMGTLDGVNYYLDNYDIIGAGTASILQSPNIFSSASFPSGTGILNGPPMTVPTGTYNIRFNTVTKAYSFEFVKVSLIGPALAGWNADTYMDTTDGTNYALTYTCNTGEAKFRLNDVWTYNYGGVFPAATGQLYGQNINVPAGTYTITFNRETGVYNFAQAPAAIDSNAMLQKIKMYPNPASDKWHFESTEKIDAVKIYDVTGKEIYFKIINDEKAYVDIASFQTGIYQAKVIAGDKVQVIKAVKN